MNQMIAPPATIKKTGYTGVKVSSILKALGLSETKQHMRLCQIDEVSRINNRYDRHNYISDAEMNYIWTLYWNFILNDFRFEPNVEYRKKKVTIEVTILEKYTKLNQKKD